MSQQTKIHKVYPEGAFTSIQEVKDFVNKVKKENGSEYIYRAVENLGKGSLIRCYLIDSSSMEHLEYGILVKYNNGQPLFLHLASYFHHPRACYPRLLFRDYIRAWAHQLKTSRKD